MKSDPSVRIALVILLILLALVGGTGTGAWAKPDGPAGDGVRPGVVLIAYREGRGPASIAEELRNVHAEGAGTIYGSDVQVLHVPEGRERAISAILGHNPNVLYAEPDYQYQTLVTPNDPSLSQQWSHSRIHSEAAWDVTTGTSDIIIAVIDTGVDETHPDLASKLVPGQSFLGNGHQDSTPHDLNGHGTHVAGIAAAITNNGQGVAGMSWGAKVMPIRVLDAEGSGYTSDIAAGINWARDHGANIVNLSLGGPTFSTTLQNAINAAYNAGILVVAAAGNAGDATVNYPAAGDHVLCVSATDETDHRAPYSNYGPHVDVAAPGGFMSYLHDSGGILSTLPTYDVYLITDKGYARNYDYLQGTSQATPHVAGLAALILSVNPDLTPDDVQALIQDSAVDLGTSGFDDYYGHGLINAEAALDSLGIATPTLLAIENADNNGDFWVDWGDVQFATLYELQEDDNTGFSSPAVRYSGSTSQYQVLNQTPGVWYYRVRAKGGSLTSEWSNIQSTGVVPNVPALNTVVNTGEPDAYRLSWNSVTGAAGYRLEESTNTAFTSSVVRYLGTQTSYNVTGQTAGRWYYRVRAYNDVGNSLWSSTRYTDVVTAEIPAPVLQSVSVSDGSKSYTMKWTAVPTATGYTLEQAISPYFEAPTVIYSGATPQATLTDQPVGTWYYRVRALTPAGKSPWSNTQSVRISADIFMPLVMKILYLPAELHNGGFEDGPTAWTESSTQGYPIIVDADALAYLGLAPHSGQWAAWLGGVLDEVSAIAQIVTVGSEADQLTYWHVIGSQEDDCTSDVAEVLVNGTIVESYGLCKSARTGGWAAHSVDLSAYRGQTVVLKIQTETDGDLNSNLLVDDVSFQSAAVQSTPDAGPAPIGADDPKPGP